MTARGTTELKNVACLQVGKLNLFPLQKNYKRHKSNVKCEDCSPLVHHAEF